MSDKVKIYHVWGDQVLGTEKMLEEIQHSDIEAVILFCAQEYEMLHFLEQRSSNFIPRLQEIILRRDIELHVIFGSAHPMGPPDKLYSLPIENTYLYYFPLFWAYAAYCYDGHRRTTPDNQYPEVNADRLFISLVNKGHRHRCLVMDLFAKYDLIDTDDSPTYYSWHNYENQEYEFNFWNEKRTYLGDGYKDTLDSYAQIPDQMWKSALNIVIESSPYGIFWTEKTFQAISLGKPFIIFGGPGMNIRLKQYGFKLFDEFFEYSEIENMGITEERYQRTVYNLNALVSKYSDNPQILYDKCKERCEHNKRRLNEIVKNKLFIPKNIKLLMEKYNLNWESDFHMGYPF